MKRFELREKARLDYAHYIEWNEFPFLTTSAGKMLLFSAIGFVSIIDPAPFDKTIIALGVVGTLGYVVEAAIIHERPLPTKKYKMDGSICANCRAASHADCTNLRMLDGYDKGFRDEKGYSRPVCCCGFRLGAWEEVGL